MRCERGSSSLGSNCTGRRRACWSSAAMRRLGDNGADLASRKPSRSWVHVHLRQVSAWGIPAPPQDTGRPHAGEASGDQGAVAWPHARRRPRTGAMAEGGGHGILRISRGAHELAGTACVPISRHGTLAAHASATQSEGQSDVGSHDEDRCCMAAVAPSPSSMAKRAICRQTPEVGAQRVNCARWDLCGGRPAMGVPTAITPAKTEFCRADYVALYNHQLPQWALKSKTPIQTMKDWYATHTHLFIKRPYDRPGCDNPRNALGCRCCNDNLMTYRCTNQ